MADATYENNKDGDNAADNISGNNDGGNAADNISGNNDGGKDIASTISVSNDGGNNTDDNISTNNDGGNNTTDNISTSNDGGNNTTDNISGNNDGRNAADNISGNNDGANTDGNISASNDGDNAAGNISEEGTRETNRENSPIPVRRSSASSSESLDRDEITSPAVAFIADEGVRFIPAARQPRTPRIPVNVFKKMVPLTTLGALVAVVTFILSLCHLAGGRFLGGMEVPHMGGLAVFLDLGMAGISFIILIFLNRCYHGIWVYNTHTFCWNYFWVVSNLLLATVNLDTVAKDIIIIMIIICNFLLILFFPLMKLLHYIVNRH
ncbi:hypothetical protein Ahia01_000613000 [Argonauta hians]